MSSEIYSWGAARRLLAGEIISVLPPVAKAVIMGLAANLIPSQHKHLLEL